MIAYILAPFVIVILSFVYIRINNYLNNFNSVIKVLASIIIAIVLFGGIICILLGHLLPLSNIKRVLVRLGFYYLGFILYFCMSLIIALIIRYIVWLIINKNNYNYNLARNITTLFVVTFTVLMGVYGINNAHKLHVTNYEVSIDKESDIDELKVVLLADLHLGYNTGLNEVKDMVDTINSLNPDVIVMAGDIFDNEYEAIDKPDEIIEALSTLKPKYGKYVTYGNHDIQEKILCGFTFTLSKIEKSKVQADERMNQFIKDAGFELLYDSYVLLDDSVYIYGRPDAHKINFGNLDRVKASDITKDLNKSLPIIVVDHQPSELNELAKAGVDLDLSGHTHKGQLWPGTLTINLMWDNAYGMKKIDDMYSIVTSGVGLFGPNMRVDSIAEVCNINIKFK